MHNRKYRCHMAVCCTYHRPTYFSYLLNRSHTKKLSLNENYWKNFLEKFRRMDQLAEKKIRQKE